MAKENIDNMINPLNMNNDIDSESEEELYGHKRAWCKKLEINQITLNKRLNGVEGVLGKASNGKLLLFYAESDVRRVCADLLVPKLDENGEVMIGDVPGVCIRPFSRRHNLELGYVFKLAREAKLEIISKARSNSGPPSDVYRKQDILQLEYVRENISVARKNRSEKWYEKANSLSKWLEEHKGLWPKRREKRNEETCLAEWIFFQRKQCMEGKLSDAQVQFLEDLGIEWEPDEKVWREKIQECITFRSAHSRLPCSKKRTDNEKKLSTWLANQKLAYKRRRLTSDKIALLQELGISWNSYETNWGQFLSDLRNFIASNNRWPSNKAQDGKERSLANWVTRQRRSCEQNKLDAKKIASLDELGMVWKVFDDNYQETLMGLQKFLSEHGEWPTVHTNRPLLGWVSRQRRAYRSGGLEADKVEALEALGIEWNPKDASWTSYADDLQSILVHEKRWPNEEGGSREQQIVRWMHQQRHRYKIGKLSHDRIKKLESMGFAWTGKFPDISSDITDHHA